MLRTTDLQHVDLRVLLCMLCYCVYMDHGILYCLCPAWASWLGPYPNNLTRTSKVLFSYFVLVFLHSLWHQDSKRPQSSVDIDRLNFPQKQTQLIVSLRLLIIVLLVTVPEVIYFPLIVKEVSVVAVINHTRKLGDGEC